MSELNNLKPLKLGGLEPSNVFFYFEEISKIPRGSGNEKAISDYLIKFARKYDLDCSQDKSLNVIIKKPATKNYQNTPCVIIQGHMDMVCEKNSDSSHNFEKDSIGLIVDGDYIRANGTTLGADNGIAIAYTLALLASDNIEHPGIEALFTSDEEAGMNGAYALDMKQLAGKMLINIDSEEEGTFLVSCAGGVRTTLHLPMEWEYTLDKDAFVVSIRGLRGGHSGSEIDKQRANSNKIMGRILNRLYHDFDIYIVDISGGAKDNAIPREADATILVKENERCNIEKVIKELEGIYINEFKNTDADIHIELKQIPKPEKTLTKDLTKKIIDTLILIPDGIQVMSSDIKGLVESSTNIGVVKTLEKEIVFTSAVRSSIATKKDAIIVQMEHLAKLVKGTLTVYGEYPAWEYNPNSKLKDIFLKVYKNMYGKDAEIKSIHAGLECGIFAKKMKGIDMISLGPNIIDPHSPDERISISSVARIWDYLKEVLKELK